MREQLQRRLGVGEALERLNGVQRSTRIFRTGDGALWTGWGAMRGSRDGAARSASEQVIER